MDITVNGHLRTVESDVTVAQLVATETGQDQPQGVAVAVDGAVVPASQWERVLHPGAVVDILTAVQGG